MKRNNLFSKLLTLFLVFFKIGLLTFGGGYAMIPIIEEEVTRKRKWISSNEIIDIIAISESTPGPISVNTATYVGYKVAGIPGAILSTLGLAFPSFIIILILSFFYKQFLENKYVQAIFKGLKVGVIILLINALFKLKKGIKFNIISIILFIVSLGLVLTFNILNIDFNYLSICLIALGLTIGASLTALGRKENK